MNDLHEAPCPACRGRGEIVMTGRKGSAWISIQCEDCRGTGLADPPPPQPRYRPDGTRIPEDGEEYDEAVHGPLPAATLTSAAVCSACFGARRLLSPDGSSRPCPRCARQ